MSDPIVDAFTEYERAVAPAYEVIRRARARLADRVAVAAGAELPFAGAWGRLGDPTEPNGAELAVEGAIQHPEQGLLLGDTSSAAPSDPAPESQPGSVPAEGVEAMPGEALSAPSPQPEGSPTPAPHTCPTCGYVGKSDNGLRIHAGRMGHEYPLTVSEAQASDPAAADPRTIPETPCFRGCGRKFRWQPALDSHEKTCVGTRS